MAIHTEKIHQRESAGEAVDSECKTTKKRTKETTENVSSTNVKEESFPNEQTDWRKAKL